MNLTVLSNNRRKVIFSVVLALIMVVMNTPAEASKLYFLHNLNDFNYEVFIETKDKGAMSGSNKELKKMVIPLSSVASIYSAPLDMHWSNIDIQSSRSEISDNAGNDEEPAPIPEPGTLLMLGSGLIGIAVYLRLRKT